LDPKLKCYQMFKSGFIIWESLLETGVELVIVQNINKINLVFK